MHWVKVPGSWAQHFVLHNKDGYTTCSYFKTDMTTTTNWSSKYWTLTVPSEYRRDIPTYLYFKVHARALPTTSNKCHQTPRVVYLLGAVGCWPDEGSGRWTCQIGQLTLTGVKSQYQEVNVCILTTHTPASSESWCMSFLPRPTGPQLPHPPLSPPYLLHVVDPTQPHYFPLVPLGRRAHLSSLAVATNNVPWWSPPLGWWSGRERTLINYLIFYKGRGGWFTLTEWTLGFWM